MAITKLRSECARLLWGSLPCDWRSEKNCEFALVLRPDGPFCFAECGAAWTDRVRVSGLRARTQHTNMARVRDARTTRAGSHAAITHKPMLAISCVTGVCLWCGRVGWWVVVLHRVNSLAYL
eukprot:3175246-Prymnesium_polylepis.1